MAAYFPTSRYRREVKPTPDHSHKSELIKANLALPKGVTVSRTALVCSQQLTIEQWKSLGRTLSQFETSMQWWIGDWWHYGCHRYRERKAMAEAKDVFGREYAFGTLMNYGYVAGRIETSFRNEVLSWTHHYVVAPLEPEQQQRWLDIAAKDKLSVAKLRDKMFEDKIGNKRESTDEEQYWLYLNQLENAARLPGSPQFALGPPPWMRTDLEDYLVYFLENQQAVLDKLPRFPDRTPYHPPSLSSLGPTVRKAAIYWTKTYLFLRRIEAKSKTVREQPPHGESRGADRGSFDVAAE